MEVQAALAQDREMNEYHGEIMQDSLSSQHNQVLSSY
jgi:hypothetical protein